MSGKPKCVVLLKGGKSCEQPARFGSLTCTRHADQELEERRKEGRQLELSIDLQKRQAP